MITIKLQCENQTIINISWEMLHWKKYKKVILYKLLCIPFNNFLCILWFFFFCLEESVANNMQSIVQNVVTGVRCVIHTLIFQFCMDISPSYQICKTVKINQKVGRKVMVLYSSKNLLFFWWKTHHILMICVSSLST